MMLKNLFFFSLFLLLSLPYGGSCWAAHPDAVQHVLVLSSYHQGFKWSDELIEGIRDRLQRARENVNLHIEQMDTKRYPKQDYDRLAQLYAAKYSGIELAAILTADDNAFNFIKKYRNRISNTAPLVFCGVNFVTREKLAGLDNFTGINEAADLGDNLDLILQLHPNTERIVAITDLTTSGAINRRQLDTLKPFYFGKLKIDHWYDLSHQELLQKLGELGRQDVVFFTSFFRDRLGNSFEFDEIAREISRNSPVPVYAGWDYNLGYGIVGGKLASGYAQGDAAGEYAVRLIEGEPVEQLPIKWRSPNRYMFDEQVLERFGIRSGNLPPDSILINHTPTTFEQHKGLILSGLAIILLLLSLISYLLLNIRRRVVAEEQLQASQRHYRDLTELLPQTVFEVDEQGRITYVNQSGLKWSGYSMQQLAASPSVLEYFAPEDHQRLLENLQQIKTGGGNRGNEYRFIKQDGNRVPVLSYSRPFNLGPGKTGVRGVLVDISDLSRAKQETLAVRLYLQNVVDLLPNILIGIDEQGRISLWNQRAESATGIPPESAHGRRLSDLLPALQPEQQKVAETIASKEPCFDSRVKRNLDGEERVWDILIYPLTLQGVDGAILHISDVTEQMRMEEVLVQTEKMMTVGGLAAGMAHEINNPLAAIMQNAQVISRRLSDELEKNRQIADQCGIRIDQIAAYLEQRQVPKMLEAIMESSNRAADIIREMLNFSRNEEAGKSTNDPNQLIDLAIDFARKDHRKYDFGKIEVHKDYGELPPLICSSTQIQQVLLNIIKNAAEAMAGWPEMDRPQQLHIATRHQNGELLIDIGDNGPGMPEEIRNRIFEPFYTTKEVGFGTGLGLSISYYIISQNHKGAIRVSSRPQQGTTFHISLPVNPQLRLAANQ